MECTCRGERERVKEGKSKGGREEERYLCAEVLIQWNLNAEVSTIPGLLNYMLQDISFYLKPISLITLDFYDSQAKVLSDIRGHCTERIKGLMTLPHQGLVRSFMYEKDGTGETGWDQMAKGPCMPA